jgi:hypothetical protein
MSNSRAYTYYTHEFRALIIKMNHSNSALRKEANTEIGNRPIWESQKPCLPHDNEPRTTMHLHGRQWNIKVIFLLFSSLRSFPTPHHMEFSTKCSHLRSAPSLNPRSSYEQGHFLREFYGVWRRVVYAEDGVAGTYLTNCMSHITERSYRHENSKYWGLSKIAVFCDVELCSYAATISPPPSG